MRMVTLARRTRPGWLLAVAALVQLACPIVVRAADECLLVSRCRAGDTARVEMLLEVGGNLKVDVNDKESLVPLKVSGKLAYDERLLTEAPAGTGPARSVRHYDRVQATLTLEKASLEPSLRPERRWIVADLAGETLTLLCPQGPLTREELDLVDTIGSSLLVEGLLPGRQVAEGDSWQHPDALMAALVGIDAVSINDVTSQVKSISPTAVKIEAGGYLDGVVDGVATHLELAAKYTFDPRAGRITWLALLVKENRKVGLIAPGLEVVARLQMKLTPGESDVLADEALTDLPLDVTAAATQLEYVAESGRLRFAYDRRWHVINDATDVVVLRLIDDGEVVAQCNLSPLADAEPGSHVPLTQFQADIEQALGERFGQFVRASESIDDRQRVRYRVDVVGEADEVPIRWRYHFLADPQGRQAATVFTLEETLEEAFGDADATIVGSLELLAPVVEKARQPTPAVR